MTLQHIDINDLTISPLNVRKYGTKDCTDLVISIRALGVLQPLLVRPAGEGFEVVAGQRRLNACRILAEEGEITPIPCLVMAEGDDAAAIEASLAENVERLPMDEVDQFKAFSKLLKEGRTAEDIAETFGITERMVAQRLALGRLHAPILTAYRKGDLHARDIRNLTMATMKQQKAWWSLVKDEGSNVPTGQRLKDWLFGGAHIPTDHALFDVEESGLPVVADLFGEDSYFADSEAFWASQNAVIAERVTAYHAEGWADVIVMDVGAYFANWDYRTASKAKGGKVFITCTSQGEVSFHEGYLTSAEAKRLEKAEAGTPPTQKPEITKAMQNYLDLHRHAAVRRDLLDAPDMALRLIAAHMIAGSSLWDVQADPQKGTKPDIAESLATNTAQQAFEAESQAVAELLERDGTLLATRGGYESRPDMAIVLTKLMLLDDTSVLRILTCLMADSLAVGTDLIEMLAVELSTDMTSAWEIDDTFFDLMRDKEAINVMVAEIAGETVANQNVTATAKVQKSIIKACLDGTRTTQVENWTPRYMTVPPQGYTSRSAFVEPSLEAEGLAIAAEEHTHGSGHMAVFRASPQKKRGQP